jgi:hypothetical protein
MSATRRDVQDSRRVVMVNPLRRTLAKPMFKGLKDR